MDGKTRTFSQKMKISRRGSLADHGTASITLKKPTICFAYGSEELTISQSVVTDFRTDATHGYEVEIPLDEVVKIIDALARDGLSSSREKLVEGLVPATRSLLRLVRALSELPEEDRLD